MKLAPYCKQLYLDVTNSNSGKMTWKILKPIIQGKILYGPATDDTRDIMSFGNETFNDVFRLREFIRSLETSITMLNTNKEFRSKFDDLLGLAKSPFVQAILGGAVDIQSIEMVLDSIVNDTRVGEVVKVIGNILECFSVDRFVPVKNEKELEDVAYELAKDKMFYAAFFFTNDLSTNETSYKLRMEVDNTPVTIENKNRFWFPGAEANFELEMRYHRGFIEVQSSIDKAIIKHKKKKQFEANNKKKESSDDLDFSDLGFDNEEDSNKGSSELTDDDDFGGLKLDANGDFDDDNRTTEAATTTSTTQGPDINFGDIFKAFQENVNISSADVDKYSDDGDFWKFDDEEEPPKTEVPTTTKAESTTEETEEDLLAEPTTAPSLSRKKRQFDSIFSMFGFGGNSDDKKKQEVKYDVDDVSFHTKQFPYPKYTRDDFKKGL